MTSMHTEPEHILVVEDDKDLRESLCEALRFEGYQVICAEHGEAALRHLSTGAKPCVILLDLMMPVMDGWAFCRSRWRSQTLRQIPVILISAVDLSETNHPTGIDAFLRKPIDPEGFAALAARMAGRRSHVRPTGFIH